MGGGPCNECVRTFQGYICLVRLLCWPTSPLSVFEVVFQMIIGVNISERKRGTERTKKRKSGSHYFVHRRGAQRVTTRIMPELRYNPGYLYPGRESWCHGLSVYAVCVCNKVRLPGTGQSAHVIGGSRFTRPASNSRRTLLN